MLPCRSQIRPIVSPSDPDHEAPTGSLVRRAGVEFVRGTTFGWGRRDLATWLVGHYSACLIVDATVHPDGESAASTYRALRPAMRLDDERVERLILDARCSVLK